MDGPRSLAAAAVTAALSNVDGRSARHSVGMPVGRQSCNIDATGRYAANHDAERIVVERSPGLLQRLAAAALPRTTRPTIIAARRRRLSGGGRSDGSWRP